MTSILQTLWENIRILIQISLEFAHKDLIDSRLAFFQVCHLYGAKPLPKQMISHITDASICIIMAQWGKGFAYELLNHWGRVTHIFVSKLTIIGSDNGLSPDRRQAIIWTNAGILLIGPLETIFSEILI